MFGCVQRNVMMENTTMKRVYEVKVQGENGRGSPGRTQIQEEKEKSEKKGKMEQHSRCGMGQSGGRLKG